MIFRGAVALLALTSPCLAADWASIVNPEYVAESRPLVEIHGNTSSPVFVFLQKFPLFPLFVIYHTEVLVCPRDGFSNEDQATLDSKIANMTDFSEIDVSWWKTRTANCVEMGYGMVPSTKTCSGAPHGAKQEQYPMNAKRAVILNANVWAKSVYIYGTGSFDGNVAYHNMCDKKCWSYWAGIDYNLLTNNCNTFTSTVLSCVYGLSQKKPNLGPSDMTTVKGHCPAAVASALVATKDQFLV